MRNLQIWGLLQQTHFATAHRPVSSIYRNKNLLSLHVNTYLNINFLCAEIGRFSMESGFLENFSLFSARNIVFLLRLLNADMSIDHVFVEYFILCNFNKICIQNFINLFVQLSFNTADFINQIFTQYVMD